MSQYPLNKNETHQTERYNQTMRGPQERNVNNGHAGESFVGIIKTDLETVSKQYVSVLHLSACNKTFSVQDLAEST